MVLERSFPSWIFRNLSPFSGVLCGWCLYWGPLDEYVCFCHLIQASRGLPQPSAGTSSPTQEATVWTPWTLRTTLKAGALTWTWSSSTSTRSTGSSASSSSACSATSSFLRFDALQEQTAQSHRRSKY